MVIPTLKVDSIAILLLILIFLPWILPYLKGLELPGGIKIELRDIKDAVEKFTNKEIKLSGKIKAKSSLGGKLEKESTDTISILHRVAEYEPNLALVGFRIEIEKKIRKLAENNGMRIDRPLMRIISELLQNEILPPSKASGLVELVDFGNHAAHGAKVSNDAVQWVLDYGPEILNTLDNKPKRE